MNGILFELTDNNGIRWMGKMLDVAGPVWLMYQYPNSNLWTTKRKLDEQEVEGYQRLAGCYTRG